MKIVVTGGGSGGHITPILAVAHEIKKAQPQAEIIYVGQTGDALGDLPAQDKNIDAVKTVRAGKLRRYHGEGIWQIFDIPTVLKNIRDVFYTFIGTFQSLFLLRRLKPDVVFIKGGFVGVPIGLAAAFWRIPYITHDSDAIPGLANRIIAPWAYMHAVAMPKEVYAYPQDKTVTVGVPVSYNYHRLSEQEKAAARQKIGLEQFTKIILVTGGGLGAQRLNEAIADCAPELLSRYPDLAIVQLAGRSKDQTLRLRYNERLSSADRPRVVVRDFVTNLYDYSAAADVVVTRAGANSLAEFAAQAKACVVVPNPFLTGGHQLKNAKVLADRKAIKMVNEDNVMRDHFALMPPLVDLLDHPKEAIELGQRLGKIEQSNASERLAMVLLDIADTTA
jgi:UDP-N-acetylglucosamine--N-acetylmuramyl-(pentapeptide) pyrophosphoryl-undecaprenol N-acetylglucosamine transferase